MTGGGRGFCVLRLDDRGDQPAGGFAGRLGRAVILWPPGRPPELARLKAQARWMETTLRRIQSRIRQLQQPERPARRANHPQT